MYVYESPTLHDIHRYFPRCKDWRFADIIIAVEYPRLIPRVVVSADWCWQRNVLILSDERSPEIAQLSYDDSACNCMPWRDARDHSLGAALPLPHYRDGSGVEDLLELLETLRARGIYLQTATTSSGWTGRVHRDNHWSDPSTADTFGEAVVRALLLDHQRLLQERIETPIGLVR